MSDDNSNISSLSARKAFDVLRIFLERYWERGLKSSDDIAVLLGSLNPVGDKGLPLDIAQWSDWLEAWNIVSIEHAPEPD